MLIKKHTTLFLRMKIPTLEAKFQIFRYIYIKKGGAALFFISNSKTWIFFFWNMEIAELIAFMAKNTNVSFCKVVEVIAETTAPKTPMENLLSAIPSQRNDISLSIKVYGIFNKELSSRYSIWYFWFYTQGITSSSQVWNSKNTATLSFHCVSNYFSFLLKTQSSYFILISLYISHTSRYDDLKPPTSPSPTAPNTESN